MDWYWLNGRLVSDKEAQIAPTDRGLLLADGVFETMRARAGTLLWLEDHLNRLREGATLLGIPIPLSDDAIHDGLKALLDKAGLPESAMRLTLTRGPSLRRGLWPPDEAVRPTVLASIAPLVTPPPVRLAVCRQTRRNEFSPLSRVKYIGYGDSLIAKREALDRGATDAVLLNTNGNVACCSVGNIFVRNHAGWATPRLQDGALRGLARARVMAALPARELTIAAHELGSIDAGIVTNSLGLTVVSHLDDRPLDGGEAPAQLASLYD
jgi:branched-chain amino acid aminotransferase